MQRSKPSVQTETEGLQAVATTTPNPEPMFTGTAPALWAGFGAFAFIFLVVILMIIRSRVVKPARRKHADATFFEPAGDNADISFEDAGDAADLDDQPLHEEALLLQQDQRVADPNVHHNPDEAEILIEHPAEDASALFDDVEEGEKPAEPKPKRSRFAALFARKKEPEKSPEPPEPQVDDPDGRQLDHQALDDQPADEDFAEVSIQQEAPPGAVADHTLADIEGLREFDDDVEARRRTEEEAERRNTEGARQQAELKIAEARRAEEEAAHAAIEQRKSDAANLQHEITDSLEERFAALSDQIETRLSGASPLGAISASDAAPDNAPTFAGDLAAQIHALRTSTENTLDDLVRRIDKFDASPQGADGLSRQIAKLTSILDERAAGATAGRVQLSDLITSALPPERYEFAKKLSNNRTADCSILLPGGHAPIAVDARFPVDAFEEFIRTRNEIGRDVPAENDYRRAVARHIVDVAEKLILPGETADSAIMFVPSETILSDLHASLPDLVQESYLARVWIVSPTTLMATLHTVSAVMADSTRARTPEPSDRGLLAEIDELRRRIAALESGAGGASASSARADVAEDAFWSQDVLEEKAHMGNFVEGARQSGAEPQDTQLGQSLSREEAAFERLERLERQEALTSAPDEIDYSGVNRPPFPLR